MKLRIIQVFDASTDPWFRLQRLDGDAWTYINSDSSIAPLQAQAERMILNTEESFRTVKEFDSDSQLLVDNPPTTE